MSLNEVKSWLGSVGFKSFGGTKVILLSNSDDSLVASLKLDSKRKCLIVGYDRFNPSLGVWQSDLSPVRTSIVGRHRVLKKIPIKLTGKSLAEVKNLVYTSFR